MAFSSENPVAVVIDAETVSAADAVGAIAALAEKFPPLILHAFGDFREPALQGWCEVLDEFGGQALQVTPTEGHDNSVPICLTMNVMEMLHGNRASAICIFCGAGDFSQLAVRVRKSGLPVFGFGTAESGETMAPWFDSWQNIDADDSGDDKFEALDEAVNPEPGGAASHSSDSVDVEARTDDMADRLAGFRPIYAAPVERTNTAAEPAAVAEAETAAMNGAETAAEPAPPASQHDAEAAEADAAAADATEDALDDIDVMAEIEGKSASRITRIRNAPPLSDENLNGKLTEDATLLLSNFITDNLNGNGYALLSDVAHAATATSLLVPPEEKSRPDEYLKQLLAGDGRFEIISLPVGDLEPEFIRRV